MRHMTTCKPLRVSIITLATAWLVFASLSLGSETDFPKLFNTEPVDDAGLMPAEKAAAQMKLPEGFHASLFAAEPEVQNPIAMTWDYRGRLWIAENYTYAERQQRFQLDLRDRVIILDGTSGDRHTQRTVFTDQVQMLTGIEVGLGGVWLMCPPQLLFIPDRTMTMFRIRKQKLFSMDLRLPIKITTTLRTDCDLVQMVGYTADAGDRAPVAWACQVHRIINVLHSKEGCGVIIRATSNLKY